MIDNDINLLIDAIQVYYPDADPEVIRFTHRFLTHNNQSKCDVQMLQRHFGGGHSYYFAQLLQANFNRGKVCIAAPYARFVWLDNNIPYTIEGIYNSCVQKFIPVDELNKWELQRLIQVSPNEPICLDKYLSDFLVTHR